MSEFDPVDLTGVEPDSLEGTWLKRIEELKLLRKQNQIATQALFDICQSDWGIGDSMARLAHKAIKEMAALREDQDEG